MTSLFEKHQEKLRQAIQALHERTYYAGFPEHPSPEIYGETADADGQRRFTALLNKRFDQLLQKDPLDWIGAEESPYTQELLGITYPAFPVDVLLQRAQSAFQQWRKLGVTYRAGILMESLERIQRRFFEIAYASMHTTGQGFLMAFQSSGPHAADRALEAIAAGVEELQRFPSNVVWDKPMGKANVKLQKEWRAIPKGVSLVVGCSTFPTWNSLPGVYASLITGNAVVVKPHGGAVLPMAIIISEIQQVFFENNIDANLCQLGVDTVEQPITLTLAQHSVVKLIDYTGTTAFGAELENIPGKVVFTEKAGVNSVILDSAVDIDKVAANLAFSLTLYSGQMCTAPQNFFIPKDGIGTPTGKIPVDDFAMKLVDNINAIIDNPKAGPFILGAIQNKKTCERIVEAEKIPGKLILRSRTVENPGFKKARVHTPVLVQVSSEASEIFNKELFGPIGLLIVTNDTSESISLAQDLALRHGAISCGAYTTSKDVRDEISDAMAMAATPVSFNLTGGIYMNQNAAFSDFHVTGGNPSGNASFTNPEFINKRFTWVGHREPVAIS